MALRQLTPAEITAAKLRTMAHDLILEAEALESTVGQSKTKRKKNRRIPPLEELYGRFKTSHI